MSAHGDIFANVGKYARGAVLYAFEKAGGADGLAKWAEDNPDDFYTKLFPKIITRETEVHHHNTIDDLMDVLDGNYSVEGEGEDGLLPTDSDYIGFEFQDAAEGGPVSNESDFDVDDFVEFTDD